MKYKLLGVLLLIILILYGTVVPVSAETGTGINGTVSRLAGQDYCQTSVVIANAYNNNSECNNIILASGNSILSKKVNAPVLLVGSTVNDSSDAFTYMSNEAVFCA